MGLREGEIVLQSVAECCSALQCVAGGVTGLRVGVFVLQCVAVRCSASKCVASGVLRVQVFEDMVGASVLTGVLCVRVCVRVCVCVCVLMGVEVVVSEKAVKDCTFSKVSSLVNILKRLKVSSTLLSHVNFTLILHIRMEWLRLVAS